MQKLCRPVHGLEREEHCSRTKTLVRHDESKLRGLAGSVATQRLVSHRIEFARLDIGLKLAIPGEEKGTGYFILPAGEEKGTGYFILPGSC